MFDFVTLDGGGFRDHLLQQLAQLGDAPLPIAEIIEVATDDLVPAGMKDFEKRAVGSYHAQLLVKHEQGLADSVDDVLGLDTGAAKQAVEVVEVHPIPAP